MAKHFRSTLDFGGSQHVTIASEAIAASAYAEISTTKHTRLHTLFAPMCISIFLFNPRRFFLCILFLLVLTPGVVAAGDHGHN